MRRGKFSTTVTYKVNTIIDRFQCLNKLTKFKIKKYSTKKFKINVSKYTNTILRIFTKIYIQELYANI